MPEGISFECKLFLDPKQVLLGEMDNCFLKLPVSPLNSRTKCKFI